MRLRLQNLERIYKQMIMMSSDIIILLFALFTISGGIQFKGTLVGTPKLN